MHMYVHYANLRMSIMYISQEGRRVDGSVTLSVATSGVEEKKSKREKIIDKILTMEMAYIKDLTDIIDVRETWSI